MSELTISDLRLKPIADKVLSGERLSFDDGITLYRSPDLLAVEEQPGEAEALIAEAQASHAALREAGRYWR